jgi:hypothetical protein
MRIEVGEPAPASGRTVASIKPAGKIDRLELLVLVAFGVVSLWVLGLDLWQVVVHGRVWTGTDGVYIVDQMQYLAWIRSASHHLLVSNLFVLRGTPADYFQPAVAISGGLSALGLAPTLSLLLWKPIAVIGAFFGVRAFAHASLSGRWPRLAAITLGLFFGSFTIVYGSFGVIGDLFPGFLSWGYTFGLLALAAMVYALVRYDRSRLAEKPSWVPGLIGAGASLLHPWNGELLIVVIVLAELVLWRGGGFGRRRLTLPCLTLALTGLPLLYYVALGRTDLSWQLAREASKHTFPLWSILLVILPLLIPAALAYRGRPRSFIAAATQTWPFGAVGVFLVSASGVAATPLHAFQGITIPLGVLAVQGVQRLRWHELRYRSVLAVAAVALFTIPATAYELDNARRLAKPTVDNANFITSDERAALDYLADNREPGGVLTRSYLGAAIPGKTGRRTLVGDCLWSEPNCYRRSRLSQALFDGALSPSAARSFVRQSGARFVLADCTAKANLLQILRPTVASVHRFGCASVLELDLPGPATGPLAKSGSHAAALRAPRRQ